MEKIIDLLKQAQDRIQAMLIDFPLIAAKAKEIEALLAKHTNGPPIGPDLSKLSERERVIFDLIGKNLKNGQIAKQLKISIKTFNSHRENIRAKLKIENSYELRRVAIRMREGL